MARLGRLRHGSAARALSIAATVATASTAEAQTSLRGQGIATLSWTDNALNAPDSSPEGGPERVDGIALAVTPGASFIHQRARVTYSVAYSHSAQMPLTYDQAVSTSNVLAASGEFELSLRDTLGLSLFGSHSRTSDLLSTPSRRSAATPTPVGSRQIVAIGTAESFSHALTEAWTLEQNAEFDQSVPVFDDSGEPAYFTVSQGLSLSHARQRSVAGIRGAAEYLGTSEALPAEAEEPIHWSGSLVAFWNYQLLQDVSSQLGAGTSVALRPNSQPLVAPTLTGMLEHAGARASESLTLSRSLTSDSLTGSLLLSDAVQVAALVDLAPLAGLSGRTTHGYSRTRIISEDETSSAVSLWISEVALDWGVMPGALGISVVYQHLRQAGLGDEALQLADFNRNQVMLVISGTVPRGGLQLSGRRTVGERAQERPLGGGAGAISSSRPSRGDKPAQPSDAGGDAPSAAKP